MPTMTGLSGERVRALREELKLNQRELAERAGLTPGAISHIEQGRRVKRPGLDTVRKLANALGVSVDELLD